MRAIVDDSARSKNRKNWLALTRFQKITDGEGLSLLEVEMESGVTHQIRVHLAAIGHPIVGDTLYGGEGRERFGLNRHFLHAHGLEFFHPRDQRVVRTASELPVELKTIIKRLGPMR
jgi:23S rRNA pseudouridine1911/1915/1917 synthase